MINNFIAITIGDIKGIGIEILLKLWKKNKINRFIIFSNKQIIQNYLNKKKLKIQLKIINNQIKIINKFDSNKFLFIYDFKASNIDKNTYKSLIESYKFTKKYSLKGIITLPLNKEKMKLINKKFIGQTEFFQKLDKKDVSNMIFVYNKIIVATLTNHIPINKIIIELSKKKFILNKIINLHNTLINDFDIKNPRLIISGINPHCSENGTIGKDDMKILIPNIKKIKDKKIKITGPVSGDAMINKCNIKKYDCFIFNFHDQALIPFKILSDHSGINYTTGLSILRVSPDHGTAYDIVGKNIENSNSLYNCFKIIKKISVNRT